MTKVSKNSRFSGFGSVFSQIGAAVDVARAVDNHKMPPAGALRALGIDADAFRRINLR